MKNLNKEQLIELLISSDSEIRMLAYNYMEDNFNLDIPLNINAGELGEKYYTISKGTYLSKIKAEEFLFRETQYYFTSSEESRPYITSLLNCIFEYNGEIK